MKKILVILSAVVCLMVSVPAMAQDSVREAKDSVALVDKDTLTADSAMALVAADLEGMDGEVQEGGGGLHKQLKRKFMEGSASFMSLVALALILGLAFCIERLIYLTLSEINAKKLMQDIDARLEQGDVEGAKDLCRDTRGPVASICYQGLLHIKEPLDQIDRQLTNYGTVQIGNMEKGCSWIRLFIAVAPSLGFLGTVIGMVMAFDRIQTAGDISPTIVAEGMKVALITTIFGIIVAVILQFFYNYILSKIEHLTSQMEESAISLTDSIAKYKSNNDNDNVNDN
jgi:biopolymer transport protein ExbB